MVPHGLRGTATDEGQPELPAGAAAETFLLLMCMPFTWSLKCLITLDT